MIETLIVSNQPNNSPNVITLSDILLKELNLTNNTELKIKKYEDGRIELSPTQEYAKGDIRRLKGLVKTDITASLEEMQDGIAMGAIYGE